VDSPNQGHQSPEGTYEKVFKSVLEDPSFTLAEFRALLYLVTKPDGWVIRESQLAQALGWKPNMARRALIGLRTKGYIKTQAARDERGGFSRHASRLRRGLVIKPGKAQAGPTVAENAIVDSATVAENAIVEPTSQNGTSPQVGSTVAFHHSVVKPRLRENCLGSEDGEGLEKESRPARPATNGLAPPPAASQKVKISNGSAARDLTEAEEAKLLDGLEL
jgi:hypothetical protein